MEVKVKKLNRLYLWIKTCFSINPVYLIIYLLSNVTGIFLGALFLVYSGKLIDEVVGKFQGRSDASPCLFLIQIVTIGFFAAALRFVSGVAEKRLTDDMEIFLSERFFHVVKKADFLLFEKKDFQDKMDAAKMVNSGAVMWMIIRFSEVLSSVISLIAYVSILITASIGAIIIAGFLCLVISAFKGMKRSKDRTAERLELIEGERKLSYFESLLFSPQVTKEIHTFNLSNDMKNEWKRKFQEIQDGQISITLKDNNHNFFLNMVSIALTMMLIVLSFYLGQIDSPGKFTVVLAAYTILMETIKNVGTAVGNFYESSVYLEQLDDFESLGGKEKIPYIESDSKISEDYAIELKDVSFSYDDGKTYALKKVDIAIKKGQVVAFVGENGAGKTTLSNIILGLYKPEKGSVTVAGEDPYHDRSGVPKIISVSQTFGRYYGLTLKENVAFGLNQGLYSRDEDFEVLFNNVGLDCNLNIHKVLGNQFDGIDLSEGQWQRIAVLRSLVDTAEVVILDEPTAALDPFSEIEVFNQLMEMHKEKTIILITHRLGIAKNADEIVVLHNGEIVERGKHEFLMKQKGHYKKMFDSQAQWYTDKKGGVLIEQQG